MSRIGRVFAERNHKALIAYVTVGYPSVEATMRAVPLLASCGCDIIELGIPFSDPLADGTTIQQASFRSLNAGTTPSTCMEIARSLRKVTEVPLVFMTYYNPVHRYGIGAFCGDCSEAGIDGLIVPDLPPEEGGELEEAGQEAGLDLIYLLAPTSDDNRIRAVAGRSRGFVYLVSLTGVTGARNTLPADLSGFVQRVRRCTDNPLCVGFGISTPEQAKEVTQFADGVIVGSRIMQILDEEDPLSKIESFARSMRSAVSNGIRR